MKKVFLKELILMISAVTTIIFVSCNPTQIPKEYVYDVYLTGYEQDSLTKKYKVMLWKNGEATALTNGEYYARGNSVFVYGEDVYVGGYEFNEIDKRVAKLWKNGKNTELADGERHAEIYSLFIDNNNVYAFGQENKTKESMSSVAKIWRNNEGYYLTTEERSYAHSGFVSANNVYAAGYELQKAMLWKNGEATSFTNGEKFAFANSIFVLGEDVYVGGSHNDTAIVWKNGKSIALTDGKREADINSVFVVGNDIYAAGYECNEANKPVAKIWKNGKATTLSSKKSMAESLYVIDDDVYVVGNEEGRKAMLWKNGEATAFNDGKYIANIKSVFVVKREKNNN